MTSIAAALHDLLNEQSLDLEQAVRRHFTDGYRQRTDGLWDGRERFVEHIAHLRTIVDRVHVSVIDELVDGSAYADRHIVRIVKTDGSEVVQEVYLFGELAGDGRFSRIEEVTMMLEGDEADRAIGSAR